MWSYSFLIKSESSRCRKRFREKIDSIVFHSFDLTVWTRVASLEQFYRLNRTFRFVKNACLSSKIDINPDCFQTQQSSFVIMLYQKNFDRDLCFHRCNKIISENICLNHFSLCVRNGRPNILLGWNSILWGQTMS